MSDNRRLRIPNLVFRLAGIVLLILVWALLSHESSQLIITGPLDTAKALVSLLGDQDFVTRHLASTLERLLISLCIGVSVGCLLGVAAGLRPEIRLILDPLRWMLMSIPGVVVVVVFMLWFGMGTTMVVGITSTLIAPLVYVNIVDGLLSVDRDLVEMSRVYGFPLSMRLAKIYAPVLTGPFLSGVIIATSNGVRVVVLAELLGASQGIGYSLALARTNLETENLYALALLSMLIVCAIELVLLRPARKRIQRSAP